MTNHVGRFICCSTLLIFSLLLNAGPAFPAIAPDVTSLSSISASLSTPVRLAADISGSLYVSDPRSRGIVKFASDGSHAATIPVGTGILGVAVTATGEILVCQGTSVAVYSSTGTKLKEFGTFTKANGISITKNGVIFVVDSLSNSIQAFNASDYSPHKIGASNSFGTAGTASGQFRQPTGIAYEKVADQIAVVDTRNGRIQFFSTTGVYQKSIGSFGAGPLKFTSPQSVSFEYSTDQTVLKRIYVVDSFQSTIQVIDAATSEFVRYIGGYGVTDGKLVTPSDILFDKNSRLVVANGTGKLSLFGVADPSLGPFLQIDTVPQATNLTTLTITGTTTGTAVSINGVPGTLVGTVWSGNVSLTPGVNPVTVVASDAKGSTSRMLTVTALAPAVNPVSLTVTPVATQTSQSALTLSGTVTEGASVTVNGAAALVTGAAWSMKINLSTGLNTLRIIASKAGMGNSTADVSVVLDTSTPVIATRLPSPGSVFSTPLQTLSGTVSSSNATTIIVTVNGTSQTSPVSDGIFFVPVVLALGNNNISIVGVDSFGATTQALASSVSYNPQTPKVIIATPAAAVSGTATYRLEGTAPSGSSVTINGAAAVLSGVGWSADVQLSPGVNNFEVKASQASGVSTTAVTAVAYSPGLPSLSITSPAKDSPVATSYNNVSGTASPSAIVSARVNDVPASVTTSASGSFSIAIPTLTTPGTYTVTVSVTDATGATSTSSRSILYDPNSPVINSVTTSPIKVTAPGGVLVAKDKNGAVGASTVTNGIATLDLTGVSYDPATLNIQALSPAGSSSRNGDLNGDGKLDIADALLALRVLVGLEPELSAQQLLRGDVGPITNGEPTVDGQIKMSDIVVIMEKIIGLSTW
ncbi:MAG: Ig-like domain-containing protein [Desulfuromonadales bacterium]